MSASATLTHRGSLGVAVQWEAHRPFTGLFPHGSAGGLEGASQSLPGDVSCHFQKDPLPTLWPILDLVDDLILESRVGSADGVGGPS